MSELTDRIIELRKEGKKFKEISELLGCNLYYAGEICAKAGVKAPKVEKQNIVKIQKPRVYKFFEFTCEECGNKFESKRSNSKFCSDECRRVRYYRDVISKRPKISKAVHELRVCEYCGIEFITSNAGVKFCSRKCQKAKNSGTNINQLRRGNNHPTDIAFRQRVELFTSKFEFIDSSDDFLMIMCKDCGLIFNRSKTVFKPSHRHQIHCPNCADIISKSNYERLKLEIEKKLEEAEKKKAELKELREERFWSQSFNQIEIGSCAKCGAITFGKKFCSDKCSKRYYTNNSRREASRRIKIKAQMVDRDITLRKVYEKSNGICYLCNERTDFNDSEWRNGFFVVGPKYPTVEHVIPLAKGGLHSWDNVKCACHKCNSIKGDKIYG